MRTLLTLPIIMAVCLNAYSQSDVEVLVVYMCGAFSSNEQAENDSNYFNIELEMIQICKDRTDGPWIYIEQAVAETKAKPYRQRVYQIKQRSDGKIESVVYSIPDPLRFAGDYKKELPLLRLTPDSLLIKEGCEVVLYRADDRYFEGGTIDKNCSSDLRGASYATSEVMIDKDKMITWDRGFDENGNQVWGATKGGYIFPPEINASPPARDALRELFGVKIDWPYHGPGWKGPGNYFFNDGLYLPAPIDYEGINTRASVHDAILRELFSVFESAAQLAAAEARIEDLLSRVVGGVNAPEFRQCY